MLKLNISIIFYLHYINAPSAFAEAPRKGFVQLAGTEVVTSHLTEGSGVDYGPWGRWGMTGSSLGDS